MKSRFVAMGLLLLMCWLEFSTLAVTSPTADEPLHMVRGYAFAARGEDRLRLRGPVLSNALSGLALLLEPDLKLPPADDPIWLERDGTQLPQDFVWANTAPPLRMVFLARFPVLLASLLLGALVFRWAAQRSGSGPALVALALYVFCPNILAHARVATTDLITTATFFGSAYAFYEATRRPTWSWRVLSGGLLGLALAAKFSAVFLLPVMALETAIAWWRNRQQSQVWRTTLITLLVTVAGGALTVWAIYHFKIGPFDASGLSVPAPSYWGEWQALNDYLAAPLPGYLFGEISTRGWWYYYPVTLALKSSLPELVLLVAALVLAVLRRDGRKNRLLLLPPILLLASLLFSPHDLGYRYILPLVPFLFVASADVFAAARRPRWVTIGAVALIGWQIVGTLQIYPYYFAFFNEIAGGPERGRYLLSDSNLDWGQDLIGLKQYVDQHAITRLNLSYFGNTKPSVYGLSTYALPPVRAAMSEQGAWWLHRFYPPDPAPGVYAISVANLMGGLWNSQADYAYFRAQTPDAVIGHTIYVYTLPPRGPAANLSLAGLQIDQIDTTTYGQFNTNDVRPRWFDATGALIAAPGESWLALADDQALPPEFQGFFKGEAPRVRAKLTDEDRSYALYHFDLGQRLIDAAQQTHSVSGPVTFEDTATLIGYQINRAGAELTLLTYWRAGDHIVTPLQMFVHAVGADGAIVAQADRLDAAPFGWQPGDVVAQIQRLTLPSDQPPSIEIGLYNPDSGARLPILIDGQSAERLVLK